jgi:hypothetical protein
VQVWRRGCDQARCLPVTLAAATFTDDTSAPDALSVAAGAYRLVFLAFPFEA